MKIQYHDNASFSLLFKKKEILINPSGGNETDVVVVTHQSENISLSDVKAKKILDWPGEYEIEEVLIKAIEFFREPKEAEQKLGKTLIFVFHFQGYKICHLGAVGCKLTPDVIDQIGDVDVLMTPLGLEGTIDIKKAKETISSIDPKIVLPMNYGQDIEALKKEMHAEDQEVVAELDLKKVKFNPDKTELYILEKM